MKKLSMVLPLALLLAYCSGPNNTQTTTDTDIDATSASTTTTVTEDVATTSTDVGDVNTNTTTVTTDNMNHADRTIGNVTVDHSSSVISPIPDDPNDPMYQHWQRTNAQNWTWDPIYTGYRPLAGSYNTAINGDWQLIMTPELVTAWRTDDSRSLWLHDGDTYLSASESFNTRSNIAATPISESTSVGVAKSGTVTGTNTNSAVTLNGQYSSTFDPQSETFLGNNKSSVTVNGSTQAGTIASGNTSSTTQGVDNSTAVNAGTTNTMNSSKTMSTQGTVSAGVTGTTGSLDVNSINYNAYNGNLYQLPKFNLYLDNGSFTGYTGCNGISGRVEVSGTGLRFLNTTPGTAIDCMGGFDESQLVDMLRRIDSYAYVGDELHLMQGSQVLLRFKRNSPDTSLK